MSNDEKITLRLYVKVLRRAAEGEVKNLHEYEGEDPERRVVKELLDSGLLSDARTQTSFTQFVSQVTLTPAGAEALLQWSDYLEQQTFWYKAGKTITQFLWVILGAIAASIPQIVDHLLANGG